jgi:hypothetical protein
VARFRNRRALDESTLHARIFNLDLRPTEVIGHLPKGQRRRDHPVREAIQLVRMRFKSLRKGTTPEDLDARETAKTRLIVERTEEMFLHELCAALRGSTSGKTPYYRQHRHLKLSATSTLILSMIVSAFP